MTFSHMPFSLNFNLNKSEESIAIANYYGKMSYMHMHARIPPLVFHKLNIILSNDQIHIGE